MSKTDEKSRLGIQKVQGSANRVGGGSERYNAINSNRLKHPQKQNKKYKHTIKALKKKRWDENDQNIDGENKTTTTKEINLVDATARKVIRIKGAPDWRVSVGRCG